MKQDEWRSSSDQSKSDERVPYFSVHNTHHVVLELCKRDHPRDKGVNVASDEVQSVLHQQAQAGDAGVNGVRWKGVDGHYQTRDNLHGEENLLP
jgi:hypothetical protein